MLFCLSTDLFSVFSYNSVIILIHLFRDFFPGNRLTTFQSSLHCKASLDNRWHGSTVIRPPSTTSAGRLSSTRVRWTIRSRCVPWRRTWCPKRGSRPSTSTRLIGCDSRRNASAQCSRRRSMLWSSPVGRGRCFSPSCAV